MWYRMWLSGTITENTSWHGKRWIMKVYDDKWLLESIPYDKLEDVDLDYLADLMEREDLKKRLISQIHELENKLWLAKLDNLLTEYEIMDLELKIIDLKIKLLDQWHTEN
jgi:hypothetical protein